MLAGCSRQSHIARTEINRQTATPAHRHFLSGPAFQASRGFLTASLDGVGCSRPEKTLESMVPKRKNKASPSHLERDSQKKMGSLQGCPFS